MSTLTNRDAQQAARRLDPAVAAAALFFLLAVAGWGLLFVVKGELDDVLAEQRAHAKAELARMRHGDAGR